jgi:tetratricopeptide (TPR) repeat protein
LALALGAPSAAQQAGDVSQDRDGQNGNGTAPAPPSFKDVLKNPGDARLSFRYARRQIREGNLTGAATTLDRILLQRPGLQDVRLLYGIVLYRLGDLASAEAELARVERDALPAKLQAELDRYKKRVAEAQRKTTFSLNTATGVAYETNPAAAPQSGEAVVFDIPLDVEDGEDDFSFLFDARGEVRHELDTETPVELFGEVFGSVREHFEVDSQDLLYGAVRAGATVRTLWVDVTPSVSAGALGLSDQNFYNFVGPGLRVERPLDGRATAFIDTSWVAEQFEPIDESATADERSGSRLDLRSGLQGVLTPRVQATVSVGASRKFALREYEEYLRGDLRASVTAQVFDKHFVQARVTGGFRDYQDNDPFISARTRKDTFVRAQLGYGLPVRFTEALPEVLDSVHLVPAVEYYYQDSNIRNFEYDNFSASLKISTNFNF